MGWVELQANGQKLYYISPMGTVEEVSPEAIEGDRDYLKDFKPSGDTWGSHFPEQYDWELGNSGSD